MQFTTSNFAKCSSNENANLGIAKQIEDNFGRVIMTEEPHSAVEIRPEEAMEQTKDSSRSVGREKDEAHPEKAEEEAVREGKQVDPIENREQTGDSPNKSSIAKSYSREQIEDSTEESESVKPKFRQRKLAVAGPISRIRLRRMTKDQRLRLKGRSSPESSEDTEELLKTFKKRNLLVMGQWPEEGNTKIKQKNLMVIKSWSKNRDTKEQVSKSKALVELILTTKSDERLTKLEENEWVGNIALNSKLQASKFTENMLHMKRIIAEMPRFIGEDQLGIGIGPWNKFIAQICEKAVKSSSSKLTDAATKTIITGIATVINNLINLVIEDWQIKTRTAVEYEYREGDSVKTGKWPDVVRACLTCFFSTLEFYLVTNDPSWLALDDYPGYIKVKNGETAKQTFDDENITSLQSFKISLLDYKLQEYSKKVESKNRTKKILGSHFKELQSIIDDTENKWPSSQKGLLELSIQDTGRKSIATQMIDKLFEDRVKSEDYSTIQREVKSITGLNKWAQEEGAIKVVSTAFFEAIQFEIGAVAGMNVGSSYGIIETDDRTLRERDPIGFNATEALGDYVTDTCDLLPPPIVVENSKPVRYQPEIWDPRRDGSLEVYIKEVLLGELQLQGVQEKANVAKMIYYIFGDSYSRNRYANLFLRDIGKNSSMSNAQFLALIPKICEMMDPDNIKTSFEYREEFYEAKAEGQKRDESIAAFVDRIIKLHKLAFPSNWASAEEQRHLTKHIFQGIRDETLKDYIVDFKPSVVLKGQDPQELANILIKHEQERKRIGRLKSTHASRAIMSFEREVDEECNNNEERDDMFREILRQKCKDFNLNPDGSHKVKLHEVPYRLRSRRHFNLDNYVGDKASFYKIRDETQQEVDEIFEMMENESSPSPGNGNKIKYYAVGSKNRKFDSEFERKADEARRKGNYLNLLERKEKEKILQEETTSDEDEESYEETDPYMIAKSRGFI